MNVIEKPEIRAALAVIDDSDATRDEVALAKEVLRRASDETLMDLLREARKRLGYNTFITQQDT